MIMHADIPHTWDAPHHILLNGSQLDYSSNKWAELEDSPLRLYNQGTTEVSPPAISLDPSDGYVLTLHVLHRRLWYARGEREMR